MPTHRETESVEHGSQNIFADLGLPNPEEHLVYPFTGLGRVELFRQFC